MDRPVAVTMSLPEQVSVVWSTYFVTLGIPLYADVDCGLAVADNGDIFVSDPNQHAIYRIDPSTGQSTLIAGKPGESGNAD
jgi:streptogramin lyase